MSDIIIKKYTCDNCNFSGTKFSEGRPDKQIIRKCPRCGRRPMRLENNGGYCENIK